MKTVLRDKFNVGSIAKLQGNRVKEENKRAKKRRIFSERSTLRPQRKHNTVTVSTHGVHKVKRGTHTFHFRYLKVALVTHSRRLV